MCANYADRPVTDAVLREVVDLARFAPSWKNTQVVRYHLLRDPEKLAQVAEKGVSGFAFNAKTISRCKALVLLTVQRGSAGTSRTAASPPRSRTAGRHSTPGLRPRPSASPPMPRGWAA